MKICIITGSAGLIGGECVDFFNKKFDLIIGIDNDMRGYFFGEDSSTKWNEKRLIESYDNFLSNNVDIRDYNSLENIFKQYNIDIELIIHSAAQPSHDWASKEPLTDFSINATGTINLLELTRKYCPRSTFIFTSTNKVYGDTPNYLPLIEIETRWEINKKHKFFKNGIDESMSIDNCQHSIFGSSKVAADIMCQEYGKYFDMNVGIFRGGCLTGPKHSGAELHGFLSYLIKCILHNKKYTIYGYKGKQVRDNIHSYDLVNMFWYFHQNPKKGEVYNVGGGRDNSISVIESINKVNDITNKKWSNFEVINENRTGDHIWYITDYSKFKKDYPSWRLKHNINNIFEEIISYEGNK